MTHTPHRSLSRRTFLTALLAGTSLAAPAWAAAPGTSLRPRIRPDDLGEVHVPDASDLVAESRVTGETSYAVLDVETGRLLEHGDDSTGLPPASVAKTLTSLYALHFLGPDFRFQTRILGTGTLEGGRLTGDLILDGGGDPMLDTNDLASLAAQLKASGVTEVAGRFLYHGAFLPELRQIDPIQPAHVSYNPGISGLNLNYNRVHFEWKKQNGNWAVTMDARTDQYRPDVQIARMKVVDRGGPVYTYEDANGIDSWTVADSALGNGGSRWLPVRRPSAYTAEVFRTLVRSHGIVLKDPEPIGSLPAAWQIARFDSRPLHEVLRLMLYYSTNPTAEIVGLTASVKRGLAPKSLKDSAMAMSQWAREDLKLQDVALVDHSGLGDDSRISTRDLVHMMASAPAQTGLQPLLKNIRIQKFDGPDVPMTIHAKTGTLNFVSGLAGFVEVENGRELAFAVLSGDIPRRDALTVDQRERPPGGKGWNTQAKYLQQQLLHRWAALYGTGPLPPLPAVSAGTGSAGTGSAATGGAAKPAARSPEEAAPLTATAETTAPG